MKISVLILAGSRYGENEPLAQLGHVSHKAILPVGGIPMIERVVNALEKSPHIGKIFVCIENPQSLSFLGERIEIIEARATPCESISTALLSIKTPCLITTADHALLKTEWVEEFLSNALFSAEKNQNDFMIGVAHKTQIEKDAPPTKRTYIPLSDYRFSGCNLFYCHNEKIFALLDLWNNLQQDRKHPFKMAKKLGFFILLRALLRSLNSKALKKRVYDLTGTKIDFIPLSSGLAAIDVDKIADYHLVEKILKNEANSVQ